VSLNQVTLEFLTNNNVISELQTHANTDAVVTAFLHSVAESPFPA
jgi:hypothetical protein